MGELERKIYIKYLIYTALATVAIMVAVIFWIFPFLKTYIAGLKEIEVLTLLIVLLTFITLSWKIIIYIFEFRYKITNDKKLEKAKEEGKEEGKKAAKEEAEIKNNYAFYKLSIDVNWFAWNEVIITAKVTNTGKKNSNPLYVNLYIDEGIYDDKLKTYKFPYLLHHKGADTDCILAQVTQNARHHYPNGELEAEFQNRDLLQKCIPLSHLFCRSADYLFLKRGGIFRID